MTAMTKLKTPGSGEASALPHMKKARLVGAGPVVNHGVSCRRSRIPQKTEQDREATQDEQQASATLQ